MSTAQIEELPAEVAISQMMLPSDCNTRGTVFGGTLMKMMDIAAAVQAMHHCNSTNVVTVSLQDLDLSAPAQSGDVVTVRCASLTMDSAVLVLAALG
jgi:acyl-CoA hydrolase